MKKHEDKSIANVKEVALHYGVNTLTVYAWISRRRKIGTKFFRDENNNWFVDKAYFAVYPVEKRSDLEKYTKRVKVNMTESQYLDLKANAGEMKLPVYIRYKLFSE